MADDLPDPPSRPTGPRVSRIYLARHTYRELTNVVFELHDREGEALPPVVVPLLPAALLQLNEEVGRRARVVQQILDEDQAMDDLSW